jgi:glucose/arabinose dehydrogenase
MKPKYPRRLPIILAIVAGLGITAAAWVVSRQSETGSTYQPPASPSASAEPTAISIGRAPDMALTLPAGYVVHVFADSQGRARDLEFSPGGTLLVSNPGANTVTALPDKNRDGAADEAKVVVRGGQGTHGLAFYQGKLFVAEVGRVSRYAWNESNLTATFEKELFKLPTPGGNHGNRTLTFGPDGKLYVSVGSTCNVCDEADERYATVLVSDSEGRNPRIFADGLRNAPFLAINPTSNEVWATEMGRDNLGDNIPPDEMVIVREGKNYGWPICYGNRVHDTNYDRKTYAADPCRGTEPPIYEVPAHNAPLGLAFINSKQFADNQQGDLLVAYHGSWNRTVPDGYKVVRLSVDGDKVTGSSDFITGFISGRTAAGRPVDVIFDASGNLFVSDDRAGAVYIVQKAN